MADDPFMQIDLKNFGGKLVFSSKGDLYAWVNGEYDFWNWCITPMNQDGSLGNLLNAGQMHAINQIKRRLQLIDSDPNSKDQVKHIFDSFYPTGRAIVSKSPMAEYIQSLREREDDVTAAWALAALTSAPGSAFPTNTLPALNGVISLALFRNGIKDSASAEKSALDELYQAYSENLINLQEERRQQLIKFDEISQEMSVKLQNINEQVEQIATEANNSFLAISNVAKEGFSAIQKTYDEKLSLQAPVTYWDDKKSMHFKVCIGLAISIVLFMFFSVWIISAEIGKLLPEILPGKFPSPWKLAMIVVSITMLIWVNRILIKIFLSQLHLYSDAQERKILITTYLSLLRNNEAMRDQDRSLILQILFRPVATGIVDDGGPAAGMEVFTKLITGNKL